MIDTRWVWIPIDGQWVLAYTYTDPTAGPSAKGAIVPQPITADAVRTAIDRPDRTFRDPISFRAMPIGPEDALRLGLPKDPPWIGYFEPGRPIPPPRGEPSRVVTAVVMRDGQPLAGASVTLGHVHGTARELSRRDTRTSDASGRCEFPLAPTEPATPPTMPLAAIASLPDGSSSHLVEVGPDGAVTLDVVGTSIIEGVISRAGQPTTGSVAITPTSGGVHRVQRSDDRGTYRIDGVVPGSYGLTVHGIDPTTRMIAGTPTLDTVVIRSGERLRRDYALVSGATVRVAVGVDSNRVWATIMLFQGDVGPATTSELVATWKGRPRSMFTSARSMTNSGTWIETQFLDVLPGHYTLCVSRSSGHGGHAEQPVVCQPVDVGDSPLQLSCALPEIRPS